MLLQELSHAEVPGLAFWLVGEMVWRLHGVKPSCWLRSESLLALLAGGALFVTSRRVSESRRRREVTLAADAHPPRIFGAAQIRSNNLHAWRGPAMLITDNQAQVGNDDVSGLYFREARYLRRLSLELFGESPHLCSAVQVDANLLEFSLIYPEKKGGGSDRGGERNGVRYRNLDLRLTYEVQPNGLLASVRITNRWMDHVFVDVRWRLAADFADFDEVEVERKQYAETQISAVPGGVRFRYLHPQLPLETHVLAEGGGDWSFSDGSLAGRLELNRHAEQVIRLRVTATDPEDPIEQQEMLARNEYLRRYQRTLTSVQASGSSPLAETATRSMYDLALMAQLDGQEDEWLAPVAGIPLYHAFWGPRLTHRRVAGHHF